MSWKDYIGAVLRGYDQHFYRIAAHDGAGLHLTGFGDAPNDKCISERAVDRTFMLVHEDAPGVLFCGRWGRVRDAVPEGVVTTVRTWEQQEQERWKAQEQQGAERD